ncbi:hypothetical protein JCM19992_07540 [Thermostilla marina]
MTTHRTDDRLEQPVPDAGEQRSRAALAAPLIVYLAMGIGLAFIPTAYLPPNVAYPIVYAFQVVAVTCVVLPFVGVLRQMPWRITPWGIATGFVGAGVWLGICLSPIGEFAREAAARLGGRSMLRPGYDPFVELQLFGNGVIYGYLAVRLWGLVLLVPLIEEAFLRGFFMRLVVDIEWQRVPFGKLTRGAFSAMLAYAVFSHPAEVPAAVVWFSIVAYTARRTGSFGDCVIAHAITNAALAGYALTTGDWSLL